MKNLLFKEESGVNVFAGKPVVMSERRREGQKEVEEEQQKQKHEQ